MNVKKLSERGNYNAATQRKQCNNAAIAMQ